MGFWNINVTNEAVVWWLFDRDEKTRDKVSSPSFQHAEHADRRSKVHKQYADRRIGAHIPLCAHHFF